MLRGEPAANDQSISAFLQRIQQQDGSPLPKLRFWSESSIMFFAGKAPPQSVATASHSFPSVDQQAVTCAKTTCAKLTEECPQVFTHGVSSATEVFCACCHFLIRAC